MPVDFASLASKFGGQAEPTPPVSSFADFAKGHGGEPEAAAPIPVKDPTKSLFVTPMDGDRVRVSTRGDNASHATFPSSKSAQDAINHYAQSKDFAGAVKQFGGEMHSQLPTPKAGLLTPGNINLVQQPSVPNPSGGRSTVDSFSINEDGKEILLPRVTPDGRFLSEDDAIKEYRKTGLHLGIFSDVDSANAYAEQLHEDYAAGKYRHPVMNADGVNGPATVTTPDHHAELAKPSVVFQPPPASTGDIELPAVPSFNDHITALEAAMAKAGHPVVIVSKNRTAEQQAKLYAQGRGASGPIVTEKSGKPGDESLHQLGLAVDIAFVGKDGKPDYSDKQPWEVLGQQAKALGLEWGGDWTTLKDRVHVQQVAQASAPIVKPSGQIVAPTASKPPTGKTWQQVRAAAHPAGATSDFAQEAADVLATPLRGVQQIIKGARALPGALATPVDQPAQDALAASGEMQPTPLSAATKDALSDLTEGTFKAASPLIAAGLIEAPVATAIALGVATGASEAATAAVKKLGGDEASQRLAGNVAAALAAGHGTDYVLRTFKGDIDALASRGRAARERPAPAAARVTPDAMDIEVKPQRPVSALIPDTAGQRPSTEGTPSPASPSPAPAGATFADVATAHGGVVETAAPAEPAETGAPSPAPGSTQATPAPADVKTVAKATVEALAKKSAEQATAGLGHEGDVPNTPEAQTLERQRQSAVVADTANKVTWLHGTSAKDFSLDTAKEPLFLTTSKAGAQWYVTNRGDGEGAIHEMTVAVKNPLVLDSYQAAVHLKSILDGAGIDVTLTPPTKETGWSWSVPAVAKAGPYEGSNPIDVVYLPEARKAIQAAGYDAVYDPHDVIENTSVEALVPLSKDVVTAKPAAATTKPDKARLIPTRREDGSIEYVVQPLRPGAPAESLVLPASPRAPVTPQLPPAGGGTGYVLPSFATVARAHGGEVETAPVAATGEVAQTTPDEGSAVSGDRGALAGTPPADGQAPAVAGPAGSVDRTGGELDGGSGEPGDSGRAAGAAGAGEVPKRVGVPPERGRPADVGQRSEPHDLRLAADDVVASGGPKQRIAQNLDAIDTLKTIEAENRLATPEEQAVLSKYVGWGGLSQAFDDKHPLFSRDLRELLTPTEYAAARASTPNAHYTALPVIDAIYKGLERLGVRGPVRVLEPAAGVGHFFGMMPPALAAKASRQAVEMDSISGRIVAALYPSAKVQVTPFQDAVLPEDHFDLIVSNVPFGNYQVSDPAFAKRPKALTSSIHNYYFAKALDMVRPGGLVAFITSHYTLDSADPTVREYLAKNADLVGAIRLPNTAFKANAGTEVVTDIILLQRRAKALSGEMPAWVTAKQTGDHRINAYFLEHPRMVLGRHASTGSMYSKNEYTVEPTGDLSEQLAAAIALLPAGVYAPPTTAAATPSLEDQLPSAPVPPGVRQNAWYQGMSGDLFIRQGDRGVRIDLSKEQAQHVKSLLGVRDALRTAIETMLSPGASDADVAKAQKALTKTYDGFVKQYGYIAKPKNYRALREDPDVYALQALEEWKPKADVPEKAAIFKTRTLRPHTPVTSVGTPKEAMLVSLNETGGIDWPRMADLTGQSVHDLQDALDGLVFHDPGADTWEQADRYLSGNVKAKLTAAKAAAAKDPKYTANVTALEKVQPPDLDPTDIAVRLGAPWVPGAVLDSFATHLGLPGLTFRYSPALAKWSVNDRRFGGEYSVQNTAQWGTPRKPGHVLLATALNLGDPIVYDRSGDKSVVNQAETIAARDKVEALQEEFRAWAWADHGRATKLARIYNDTMNTMRLWEPDGSHLTLPGLSSSITLRPHQKNFIWRGLQQPNTLAHHVVGAGKTLAAIGLALEKRRLGLARKPLITVPNHLPQQWGREIQRAYPAARVLVSTKADFEPAHRKRFLNRIATGDWDAVVMPMSHFGMIRVSDETFNAHLQREIAGYAAELKRAREEAGKNDPSVKELEKAKMNLEAKIRTAKDRQSKDSDVPTFERLGVDMLIVDEAHNYKKLGFPTKMTRVAGVPAGPGSQRALDLKIKIGHITQSNPTGGTVFLTGTPISNTMAEMFVLLRYLAQGALDQRGIPQFDGWAATFGQLVTAFEISPTGRGFRQKTRFAKFTNLPELVQMYRAFADVQTADMLKLPTPPLKGGKAHVTTVPASEALDHYVDELLERFAAVLGQSKTGRPKPDPREDNPLKITTDGRKAALDLRLVGLDQPEGGKVDQAAASIKRKYDEFAKQKGTQLVFADLGAPNAEKEKAGEFTVYGALRDALIGLGIPKAHIAFIQDANTDARKQALFDAMNAGDIRVLIGSSETMGAGMNVQQRLVKLHHLDAPWRPADIEQREGRILRQGNWFTEKGSALYDPKFEVEIETYVTARSFDAYLWQLLENKARFITQALKGDITARETDDADDVVLNFAQAKGAASGNPAIMEHAKTQSDLQRFEASEANHDRRKWRLQRELASLPEQIAHTEALQQHAQALVQAIAVPETKTVEIGGQSLHGQEAAEAIQAAFERSRAGKRHVTDAYHSETHPVVIGYAAGVEVRGYITTSTVFNPPTSQPKWVIASGDATMEKNAATGAGALQSLYVFLENGPRNALADHTAALATLRSSLEAAKSEAAKPFAHKDKVVALRARLKALEQELNLDKDAQAKEAAAVGAIVTTAEEDQADLAATRATDAGEADVPDAPAPVEKKRGGGGTTLQSAVIPGLKEFAEGDVGPALKQAASAVQEARSGLRLLFAPDTVSTSAGVMAGLTRANLAIQWQRLQQARIALHSAEKAMDRLYAGAETGDPAAREKFLRFTDAVEGGDLSGLSPEERTVAEWAREALDQKRGEVQAFGKLEDFLDNYFPHEWAQPSKVISALRRLFGKKPMEGPKSFLRHRSIPTVRTGVEAGLEPVSWNPVTLVQRKLHEMEKWLTVRRILEQGKETGVAKFVRSGKPQPEGWVRYPDPIGTVYGPRTEIGPTVAGHYYGPTDAVRILERYLSPGLRGNSVIYDLFRGAGNFLNQVQLSMSVFHVMTTGLESMISKQAIALERISRGQFTSAVKAQAQVPIAPILDLIRGHRGLKAFYTDDATTHQVHTLIGQVVQAGGGFGWSLFEHTGAPQRFMQAIRAGNYPGATLRALPALIEMTAWPVMEVWVPRLKMAAFLDRAAMELETLGPNPDLTEARRVLGEAWDSIDNRFGQLRYDNLFWHNTLKDLSMASVRAVGWNVGSLREMFGAPGAQAKRLGLTGGGRPTRTVNTGKKGRQEQYEQRPEPPLHPKMAWLASMVFIAGLIGALYHWLHTGNRPGELKDYYFPRNGRKNPDGSDQRVSLPGYFKDLFAWSTHPLVTAEHKINPLLETLVEMLENEDYYGVEIRHSGDPAVQQAKDVATYLASKYQPISVSRFGEDPSPENFLGVNRAPADLTRTPAEAKMRDIAQRRGYPTLTKAQALERDARRTIRSGVASRTPEGRETAREVARSGVLSPRQVALARTSSTRTTLQRQFQPLTAPEALDVYEVATPEERRILWPLLRAKVARASLPVAEQRTVRDRLKAATALPKATAEAVGR